MRPLVEVAGQRFSTSTLANDVLSGSIFVLREPNVVTIHRTPAGRYHQFPNQQRPQRLTHDIAKRVKQLLADYKEIGACAGVGVAVPEWSIQPRVA